MRVLVLLAATAVCALGSPSIPTIPLRNSAVHGLEMPAIGLGTGGYASDPSVGYGHYPECWSTTTGCGNYTYTAVLTWLKAGGRRLDCANSYNNQVSVGQAVKDSGIDRKDIFILQKIGPSQPLGYQDALNQFAKIKSDMQVDYVDLLLIHWPVQNPSQGNVSHNVTTSSDPFCNMTSPTYDPTMCRISTWKALVEIFQSGGAKAIGVSNYNSTHFQEIIDARMPLPSLTQNPFHIYRSWTQNDTIDFCRKNNIVFLGYSPLGVPDWHAFPGPDMSPTPLQDPVVLQIAQKHKVTPAQVLIQWQWALGIPVNPRSQNQQHMIENLNSYTFKLDEDEVKQLSSRPQAFCSVDPKFYECAPDS